MPRLFAVALLLLCGAAFSCAGATMPEGGGGGGPPTSVSVSPQSASLQRGGSQSFAATVVNSSDQTVTWTIDEGSAGGAISSAGVYTAPQANGTFHVRATAQVNGSSGTATVSVSGPNTPVISSFGAAPGTIAAGQSTTLSWSVTGATSLSLDGGIGDVTGKTSRSVSPVVTTTYTLTATNPAGSSVKSVNVLVTAQQAGTWVNVTPPSLSLNQADFGGGNYGMQTIGLSPANPLIVYFGTCYQGIWKTTDGGDHWTKINTGAPKDSTGRNTLDTGRNWTLAVDPTDPNVVYTVSGFGAMQGVWKSTDGGVNWSQALDPATLASDADIYSVQIDPQNHTHLLVSFHGPNGSDTGILESLDGVTWKKIPPMAGWGTGHYALFMDSTTWILATQGAGTWRTADSGSTWKKVSTENMQHGGNQLYKAANGALYLGAVQKVLRSTDGGLTWSAVAGLPQTQDGYNAVIGDGTTLYAQPANTGSSTTGAHTYYSAPESDGTTWSAFNAQTFSDGPMSMAVDRQHGIVYSSNWDAGVWRLVTGH